MCAISLQYLKKEVNIKVGFLHAGKNENLLKIDTIILMGMVKHFRSSQNSKFVISLQYVKEGVRDEVDFFCMQDKHQNGLKVDFNTLGMKFSYRVMLSLLMSVMKHSPSTQSNKFANLCNILKKKLRMEFIFCMQIDIKVSIIIGIIVFDRNGQASPKYPK